MLAVISLTVQTVFWTIISWRDIRTQRIPLWPGVVFGGAGVFVSFGSGMSAWEILGGTVIGAAVFAIAYVSRESVGYGDALCIGVIGIWNGMRAVIWILMFAMFLMLAAAVPLLFLKKVTGKTKIPAIPFLTAGMLLVKISDLWM